MYHRKISMFLYCPVVSMDQSRIYDLFLLLVRLKIFFDTTHLPCLKLGLFQV